MMQSSAISNFVYFYTYVYCRNCVKRITTSSSSSGRNNEKSRISQHLFGGNKITAQNLLKSVPPAVRDLVAATIAGVVNVILTAPLWRANSQFRVQRYLAEGKEKSEKEAGEHSAAASRTDRDTTGKAKEDSKASTSASPSSPRYEFYNASPIRTQSMEEDDIKGPRGGQHGRQTKQSQTSSCDKTSSLTSGINSSFSCKNARHISKFLYHESTRLFVKVYKIARTNPADLTAGVSASLLLVLNPVLQFVLYDWLKRRATTLLVFNREKLSLVVESVFFFLALSRNKSNKTPAVHQNPAGTSSSKELLPQVLQPPSTTTSLQDDHDEDDDLFPSKLLRWFADDGRFFVMGLIAKVIATLTTYPLQVVQSRVRVLQGTAKMLRENKAEDETEGHGGTSSGTTSPTKSSKRTAASPPPPPTSVTSCLIQLYKDHGFKALYAGMDKKLLHSALNSAFLFFFYEKIKRRLLVQHQQPVLGSAVK
ncbi:unnamed protein product [Amoebophrya sp. A120]|nr:unnamed protein product [Amoebophrya sp. A120]|eukprot:GSA120T00023592001.1